MPGLIKPWNSWMKVKIPPNFGLSNLGAINMAMKTKAKPPPFSLDTRLG
jgi:hypothetical protein